MMKTYGLSVTLHCTFVDLDWWCGTEVVAMERGGKLCIDFTG